MAGSWIADRFPQFEEAIRRLTNQHLELVDEPLHLAVSYLPETRDQQDIFLFEVIGGPGQSINSDRDLFEVTFAATSGFPMGPNEQLHLILTNLRELEVALEQDWPLANEVVRSIRNGNYEVLWKDDIGEKALTMLQAEVGRQASTHG